MKTNTRARAARESSRPAVAAPAMTYGGPVGMCERDVVAKGLVAIVNASPFEVARAAFERGWRANDEIRRDYRRGALDRLPGETRADDLRYQLDGFRGQFEIILEEVLKKAEQRMAARDIEDRAVPVPTASTKRLRRR